MLDVKTLKNTPIQLRIVSSAKYQHIYFAKNTIFFNGITMNKNIVKLLKNKIGFFTHSIATFYYLHELCNTSPYEISYQLNPKPVNGNIYCLKTM